MTEVYESFVREWLELNGYTVRTDTRFKKGGGWSDIDIIAVKPSGNHLIVGEVKADPLCEAGKTSVKEINDHLEDEELKKKVEELYGSKFEKWIYCWPWFRKQKPKEGEEEFKKRVEKDKKKYEDKYKVKIKFFSEIIDDLIDKVKKIREEEDRCEYLNNCPNLMLLQMMHAFNTEKYGHRIDIEKLKGK
ncbi:MAG: hypothetical protein L6408_02900 [Nanoarchaeota archaeon]|nr:hypothetical protein [Nanoarchaeota archaeon]